MSIVREPFYGGVEYYNTETRQVSRAYYSPTDTELSAFRSNQLDIELDELDIWASKSNEEL